MESKQRLQANTSAHQQQRRATLLARQSKCESISAAMRSKCLESMVLESLEPPEVVGQFDQFEELSKLYTIEPPYASRTQIELMFDVYDGRKLHQGGSLDEYESSQQQADGQLLESSLEQIAAGGKASGSADSRRTSALQKPSKTNRASFSWCKLLFSGGSGNGGGGSSSSKSTPLKCCLNRSDTSQELGLEEGALSPSCSAQALALAEPRSSNDAISAALAPDLDDDQEDAELKAEALHIIGPLLERMRRSSTTLSEVSARLADQSVHSGLDQPQQVILADSSLGADASGRISVCLFDKRPHMVEIKDEAENGRRWAQLEVRLRELRWKLRGCPLALGATGRNSTSASKAELEHRIGRFVRKRMRQSDRRRLHSGRANAGGDRGRSLLSSSSSSASYKLSKAELEQLVELTKNSLGHLIDAQLLLRNKLTSEQRQQQQQQQQSRGNEYETLLRNNFNLLKIWQNLEETKRLVCFVCEPVKATLSDLFWFSRQRPTATIGTGTGPMGPAAAPSSYSSGGDCPILTSPLVSLDGVQVKRGLLQILEALNYLHAICKLVHRNLNPRNILVASNDNWKLSGLEFALRFESAAISESASIMAHEGSGSLLRYSSGAGAQAALRRQRTLHQTRCDEFVKRPKSGVLQPDVNYLAPEIWASAKCSHKSDMFSFGLILGQVYDLCRHKPPISCRSNVQDYESELKKLKERRKRRLSRLVPFEMRTVLLGALDSEPNLRPSANYALQLFRRPIELCKANEDSLRHLRSSLGYLDARWLNSANINSINCASSHKKRINYFRKVTSAANRSPQRKQTRNLHLLNLLLRGVDSLAAANSGGSGANSSPAAGEFGQQQQLMEQQSTFQALRRRFEQTFESLRQLYSSTKIDESFTCPDSRSLLLVVALHRRILDQVAQMRAELPPVCRLTAANTQANRPTQNHRILAELEDRLHCLVSGQSVARLAPVLTDPLLKLDEFLLVYELVNDLLAFVGQKCRQNFIQRGRQLLNELTPLTGCPSLSSSDEEDSSHIDSGTGGGHDILGGSAGVLVGAGRQTASSRETLNNVSTATATNNNNSNHNNNSGGGSSGISVAGKMSGNRFNEYEDSFSTGKRHLQQQQQATKLPTKISITAPSPMGSTREMNRSSADSQIIDSHFMIMRRHELQQQQLQQLQHAEQESHIVERTAELGLADDYDEDELLAGAAGLLEDTSGGGHLPKQRDFGVTGGGGGEQKGVDKQGEKSRSQLIDELLRTINDDSFNNFVDFNNKFAAQTGTSSSQQSQLTAAQLANANRPKSAIDGGTQSKPCSPSALYSGGNRQQQQPGSQRPSTLALGTNQQQQQQQARSGATPSAFDNVIRRMSTNLVQNFNKMSASTLGQATDQQQQDSSGLRREKSSTSTCANSLYVDNQVPARRHSDNTINIPRIQVALSSPQAYTSRPNLNQRASVSASKLAKKWKLSAKTNQREASDKLSPNLGGALGYMRRHSSGNTTGNDQSQSNGQTSHLLLNASPFKTKSSSNLGLDFLLSNRSMKRRYSAASMLGHQTQRKAEDLLDAGMKSVQNMFS